jgi:hypothetical protein
MARVRIETTILQISHCQNANRSWGRTDDLQVVERATRREMEKTSHRELAET